MPKKVELQKIGITTKAVEYFTENPNSKKYRSIFAANLYTEKDEIVVDLDRDSFRFRINELVESYGATTLEQLMEELRVRNLFLPQENEDITGFITLNVLEQSSFVQSNLLIGKQSIDVVMVSNVPTQDVEGYNSALGRFDFQVNAGDELIVFFTN